MAAQRGSQLSIAPNLWLYVWFYSTSKTLSLIPNGGKCNSGAGIEYLPPIKDGYVFLCSILISCFGQFST